MGASRVSIEPSWAVEAMICREGPRAWNGAVGTAKFVRHRPAPLSWPHQVLDRHTAPSPIDIAVQAKAASTYRGHGSNQAIKGGDPDLGQVEAEGCGLGQRQGVERDVEGEEVGGGV